MCLWADEQFEVPEFGYQVKADIFHDGLYREYVSLFHDNGMYRFVGWAGKTIKAKRRREYFDSNPPARRKLGDPYKWKELRDLPGRLRKPYYLTGFHCFLTQADAKEYAKNIVPDGKTCIVKVEIHERHKCRTGLQDIGFGYNQVLVPCVVAPVVTFLEFVE